MENGRKGGLHQQVHGAAEGSDLNPIGIRIDADQRRPDLLRQFAALSC